MSLYLCVFDGDSEVGAVEVGAYSDFSAFRNMVCREIEGSAWASRFPVLMTHPDADGEWPLSDLAALRGELAVIVGFPAASDFRDIDDRPLAEAILDLTTLAQSVGSAILFQ
jgi:hypothetical protein